jgi:hypothetical protein
LGFILIGGYVLHVWLPATRPGAKPEPGTDQQSFVIMPSLTKKKNLKICVREIKGKLKIYSVFSLITYLSHCSR